jgi:hypothetical protein
METTSMKIKKIFDDNKINDLHRFIEKRQNINSCNVKLRYLYYTFHYSSILVTTVAVSFQTSNFEQIHIINMVDMIWIGIALNILSTMVNAFEKMNKAISKKILSDIYKIKSGEYVDETEVMDSIHESSSRSVSKGGSNNKTVIPV